MILPADLQKNSFLFFFICLSTAGGMISRPSAFAQSNAYWVFFKDKASMSDTEIAARFSQRAVLRRMKAGVRWDEYDIPVRTDYINGVAATGAQILRVSRWLNAVACSLHSRQLEDVRALDYVVSVRPCAKLKVARDFSVQHVEQVFQGHSSHFYGNSITQNRMLRADTLHALGYSGRGVVIAVFDDGFLNTNLVSGFEAMRNEGRILGGYDYVDNDSTIYNIGAHGTAVLSVLAAYLPGTLVGPAYGASFYLFRTEDGASETLAEEYNWVAAAERADELGADICQTSLGYLTFDGGIGNHVYADMDGNTTVITRAADLAASRGMVVVNSAGNEGNNAWGYVIAPADGDSVLACGSVNANRLRSGFSSTGPTFDGRIKPDVMAMGQSATFQSYTGAIGTASGTSFSAPLVSGLAACLMQAAPYVAGYTVHDAIVRSADRYHNPDNLYGYGIPDGYLALRRVAELDPDPVWPGDAHPDGIVDVSDLYLTAAAYGTTGPARNLPGVLWQAYPPPSAWDTLVHCRGRVVNARYLDANGDGFVNLFDIALTLLHRGLQH
jgi:hypothetical protein